MIPKILASYLIWILSIFPFLFRKLNPVLEAAGAAIIGTAVKEVIRAIYPVVRPETAIELGKTTPGFPSGHATVSFAIAFIVYNYNKKLGTAAFALAALVSIGRVWVGVHWWSDVIGGAILGILSGWAVLKTCK